MEDKQLARVADCQRESDPVRWEQASASPADADLNVAKPVGSTHMEPTARSVLNARPEVFGVGAGEGR